MIWGKWRKSKICKIDTCEEKKEKENSIFNHSSGPKIANLKMSIYIQTYLYDEKISR